LLQGVLRARVAELADAPHSKCGIERCVGSSPTSGTCFPCSGACGPLNVYKSPFMGPCGAHFCWWRLPPFVSRSGVAGYLFMAGRAANCMTGRWLGEGRFGWFAFFKFMTVHGEVPRWVQDCVRLKDGNRPDRHETMCQSRDGSERSGRRPRYRCRRSRTVSGERLWR
jgi:hypothetical protein